MLFLDEILSAVKYGLLSEEKLLSFLQHKPRGLEIIMTGEIVSDRIIEVADYVTEMKKVKHPFDKGTSPREGIEF